MGCVVPSQVRAISYTHLSCPQTFVKSSCGNGMDPSHAHTKQSQYRGLSFIRLGRPESRVIGWLVGWLAAWLVGLDGRLAVH